MLTRRIAEDEGLRSSEGLTLGARVTDGDGRRSTRDVQELVPTLHVEAAEYARLRTRVVILTEPRLTSDHLLELRPAPGLPKEASVVLEARRIDDEKALNGRSPNGHENPWFDVAFLRRAGRRGRSPEHTSRPLVRGVDTFLSTF